MLKFLDRDKIDYLEIKIQKAESYKIKSFRIGNSFKVHFLIAIETHLNILFKIHFNMHVKKMHFKMNFLIAC